MGLAGRLAGVVRLTHPFPSLLDGAATAAFALLAGGSPFTAGRLGVAMVALQAAIGALNDIVDAPRDAGLKPGKPIPAGLVSDGVARAVVFMGAALGLGLSMASGPATAASAILIFAVGGLYDLRFKGTPWSWLPFAVGIPLLPVYAWLGAGSPLPLAFGVLVPAAALAGAALAIANALADVERDRAAGTTTVAIQLGPRRAWTVHVALHVGVVGLALAGLAWLGGGGPWLIGVAAGGALIVAGASLTEGGGAARRERGWELEAVGTGLLGASWLAAIVLPGG